MVEPNDRSAFPHSLKKAQTLIKHVLSQTGARVFLVLYAVLLVGILHTYFPPHAIAVTSNDQIDSFLAYFGALPNVWETFLHPNFELADNMSGVTLNGIGFSELNVGRIIASIFPDYWEFSVFYFVYLSTLFVSSFLLYRQIFLTFFNRDELSGEAYAFIGFGAMLLVIMPHVSVVLGVLIGLNFFTLAVLNVLSRSSRRKILVYFTLAGLFGNFTLGGYFYMPACLVLAGWFSRNRADKAYIFKWIAIGILVSIICEYRLFIYVFFPAEISHRANWFDGLAYRWSSLYSVNEWKEAVQLGLGVSQGKTPHYHYQWNTGNITVRLTQLAFGLYFLIKLSEAAVARFKTIHFDAQEKRAFQLFGWTVLSILIVLLGYGVFKAGVFNLSLLLGMPFQFERVIVALPMLAGLLVASVLFLVSTKITLSAQRLAYLAISISMAVILANMMHEPLIRKGGNLDHFEKAGRDNPFIPNYTLGSKYNRGGYDAIKTYLGSGWEEERVASVGFDPMATAYNGFATVDGYFPNYPERYQQEFLAIINPSLSEISASKAARYTGWANRLNIPIISTTADQKIILKINGCAFSDVGGTLVLTVREIANPLDSQLVLDGIVRGENRGLKSTYWLYRVQPDVCAIDGKVS